MVIQQYAAPRRQPAAEHTGRRRSMRNPAEVAIRRQAPWHGYGYESRLAEDNSAEAQPILHAYRALLDRELGVPPSRELVCLVEYARRRQERATPLLAASVANPGKGSGWWILTVSADSHAVRPDRQGLALGDEDL